VDVIKASPAHQPEYIRRRCKLCGDLYISAKEYLEVGFCKNCAKTNGLYIPKNSIGVYRVNDQPIEELEEEEEFEEGR